MRQQRDNTRYAAHASTTSAHSAAYTLHARRTEAGRTLAQTNASATKQKKPAMAKKRAAGEGHDSTKKRKKAKKDSPFRDVAVRGTFALLPHCLDDVKGHILRRLHALLMRHSSALSGVPLAVRDVKLAPGQTLGRVQGTDPRIRVAVRLRCTVFAPQTDCVLPGRVNAIAPNYVGLLVHGYFNASIAASDLRPLHFDSGGACWRNNQQKVEVGTLIRFRLTKTHNEGGILSFEGVFVEVVAAATSPGT